MQYFTALAGHRFTCFIVLVAVLLSLSMPAQAQENTPEIVSDATTTAPVIITSTPSPYAVEVIGGAEVAVGDYVVGPGKVEVVVPAGQSVTRMITVTNRISNNRSFELTVEDMSGSVDGSQNIVLLGDVDGPYSLRDYISFPHDSFSINLGERAQVPVTITMPPNAEPGGYYGAVLVSTIQTGEGDINPGPRSPIIARIGALFFITVPGEVTANGELLDVSTINDKWWYEDGPIDFGILFENTGSVHLNPYGDIRVRNMFGEEVGYVDLEPWFVLPKSLRLREVSWDRELLFGRYTFDVRVERGYDNIVDTDQIHIWVLPWKIVLGAFCAVFALILLIRFVTRTFEFKRRS